LERSRRTRVRIPTSPRSGPPCSLTSVSFPVARSVFPGAPPDPGCGLAREGTDLVIRISTRRRPSRPARSVFPGQHYSRQRRCWAPSPQEAEFSLMARQYLTCPRCGVAGPDRGGMWSQAVGAGWAVRVWEYLRPNTVARYSQSCLAVIGWTGAAGGVAGVGARVAGDHGERDGIGVVRLARPEVGG
jgi:hypothetical protein